MTAIDGDYPCAKLGDFSFSRFDFIVGQRSKQTHTHTQANTHTHTESQTRLNSLLPRLRSALVNIQISELCVIA